MQISPFWRLLRALYLSMESRILASCFYLSDSVLQAILSSWFFHRSFTQQAVHYDRTDVSFVRCQVEIILSSTWHHASFLAEVKAWWFYPSALVPNFELYSNGSNHDKPAKKKQAPAVRVRWSNEEKALLAKTFSVTNPPVNDIVVKLRAKCPLLQKRKIENIKARAWYFIKTGRVHTCVYKAYTNVVDNIYLCGYDIHIAAGTIYIFTYIYLPPLQINAINTNGPMPRSP